MEQTNYSGRYFRTCYDDIKSSKGWFGKICLLGLIEFIPIFGQMTVYGYCWEWAHKAAWGVDSPMPKKIYGRPAARCCAGAGLRLSSPSSWRFFRASSCRSVAG